MKNEFRSAPGIKLSELGAIRCPRLSGKLGIVVGWSPYRSSLSVLFDAAAGKQTY
jgi:hypothetical protein